MERNITLDYFKLLLSFLVIAIHTQSFFFEIPVVTWIIANGISRVAVPCFFIINGFYLHDVMKDKSKFWKSFKKLLVLYILWSIIYVPFHIEVEGSVNFPNYIRTIFVAFMGYLHLWYLSALLMGSLLLYYVVKYKISYKLLFAISLLFVMLGFFLNRAYLVDIIIPTSTLTTNVVFIGFYYIFIGYLIREMDFCNKFVINAKVITAISILTLLLILESYFLYTLDKPSHVMFALPFLCPLLFLIVYKKGKMRASDGFVSKLASSVYFVHYICIFTISTIFDKSESFDMTGTNLYIIATFSSVMLGCIVIYLNKHTKMLL